MHVSPVAGNQIQEPGYMELTATGISYQPTQAANGHILESGTINSVGVDISLADSINQRLDSRTSFPAQSHIFKVTAYLRSMNVAAYTPRVVSIGPLHHDNTALQPMEAQKERYMKSLLSRNPHVTLEQLIGFLRGLEEDARCCYEDPSILQFDSDKFVKMLLLDSCFILTILVQESDKSINNSDPMYSSYSLRNHVYYDLMLVENQIPFFVLRRLFDSVNGDKQWTDKSFMDLVFSYFEKEVQIDLKTTSPQSDIIHFVDYVLKGKKPKENYKGPSEKTKLHVQLPSATQLHKCGIKFEGSNDECFLNITFTDGILKIPTLNIGDSTERKFRNLIAMEMEQHYKRPPCYVTNYIQLMDHLIDTVKDVALLRDAGVINNFLGSDEEAAQVFNNLVKGVVADFQESHYYWLLYDLSVHYKKQWNFWKAKLKRDYFNNPWAVISLIAAVVVIICSLVQALFSVLQVTVFK